MTLSAWIMMRSDFVAFILTHGRAANVDTFTTLRDCGYTGRVVFIIDDDDEQQGEYVERYGKENVYVFSKDEVGRAFDGMNNEETRKVIVYARNVCFKAARELGYRFFVELDDDYSSFTSRFDKNANFRGKKTNHLNEVFSACVAFLESTPSKSIALAQCGDYIGGGAGMFGKKITIFRKAMNSFFCDVEKPFSFNGYINEDVNTYTTLGRRGELFFSVNLFCIHQKETQTNRGGMTDVYKDGGTYIKSFYSVLSSPSCVKISAMGNKHYRIHHKVSWAFCAPKILDEKWHKKT